MEDTRSLITIAQAVRRDCPDDHTYLRLALVWIGLWWLGMLILFVIVAFL